MSPRFITLTSVQDTILEENNLNAIFFRVFTNFTVQPYQETEKCLISLPSKVNSLRQAQ